MKEEDIYRRDEGEKNRHIWDTKKETDKFGMRAEGRAFFNGQNEEKSVDKSAF